MDANLTSIAVSLVAKGKGILAADESTRTISKRFSEHDIPSTEQSRGSYRELLFTTPGIEEFISGVILYDETFRQKTSEGTLFRDLLPKKNILPGIKVDKGTVPLAGFAGEKVTEGLDGLRDRLVEYRQLGAEFAKWRAVITIGDGIPTSACIESNAHVLARYAALCQEASLVPIVEPEVLMDGSHTIQRCEEVTAEVLESMFRELDRHRVQFGGMLLKPNMVVAGKECPAPPDPEGVAKATIRCLQQVVPHSIPGIVFLSGGQTTETACENLQAIHELGRQHWELSYSFARALQSQALAIWKGQDSNVPAAQSAFLRCTKLVSAARNGRYSRELEDNMNTGNN